MRLLKKIVFFSFAIIALLLVISAVVLYVNKDVLKQGAVTELNKVLAVPIGIGSIEVSLKKFPKAAVVFNTVYCKGANASQKDTLLFAKQAYLEFDLWKVFQSPLSIDAISLEDGVLDIKRAKSGKHNYIIWKEPDSAKGSSLFALEGVFLNNMRVNYAQEDIALVIKSKQQFIRLNGAFNEEGFRFSIEHKGIVNSVNYSGTTYIKNKQLTNSLSLFNKNGEIFIKEAKVKTSFLEASYALDYSQESILFEAESTKEIRLEKLTREAKNQGWITNKMGDFSGIATANFAYKSQAGTVEYLVVGTMNEAGYKGNEIGVKKVNSSYEYLVVNGEASVNVPDFSVQYQSGKATGSLRIQNFDKPKVSAKVKATLSAADWKDLLLLDTLENVSGAMQMAFDFKNQFNSFSSITPKDLLHAEVNGNIVLKEMGFSFKNSKQNIKNLRGKVALQGKNVRLQELYFTLGNSDVFVDGSLTNAVNWAYFKGEKIRVDGRLVSQEIKLEDFIQSGESKTTKTEPYDLSFVNNVEANLILDVMAFSFYTFKATNISGMLVGRDGLFKGTNIKLNSCRGSLSGNVRLYTAELPYSGSTSFNATDVDIPQLFKSFNNFGQNTLTNHNLKGIGSAVVEARAKMNDHLEIDMNSIELTSDVRITNGELNDFEPMLALSDFASIDELEKVRFSTLQNNISISAGVITIPKMEIKNSVLDLQLVGTHTLENRIDYTIRLQLADVLFNKRKRKATKDEFDDFIQEQNPNDDPAIYIKMKGDVSNPFINLDKKAMGHSIKQDLKNQSEELKGIFKKDEEKPIKNKTGIQYTWPDEDGG